MKITVIGYQGFIGKELIKFLSKKHKIKKLDIRKIDLTLNNNQIIETLRDKIGNSRFVINCCANLKPRSVNDFIVNSKLPKLVQSSIQNLKHKAYLVHLSTLNVLLKKRMDHYTISKKRAEIGLKKNNTIILRLPLIINDSVDQKKSGNLAILHKYLNINILPFYPMIYPGHIYRPILIADLCIFISMLIKQKKPNFIYNLLGKKKLSFWDIFNNLAKSKKRKTVKVNTILVSKFLSKFRNFNYIKNSNFFSQILSIDQSNFHKVKTTKI
jgi:dTDP-4-dehydrorhamnose reductase